MSDRFDTVVIGAGVVGIAVARALAARGREVLVLERHRQPGEEITARNSGVIHAGLYYPTGSLKARLSVRGRELLYAYCSERGVAHRRCGKLVVALEPQLGALGELWKRAKANQVGDLHWLEAAAVRELEPAVRCDAALLSPSTGIVDVHGLVFALLADLEATGGIVCYGTAVESIDLRGQDIVITTASDGERLELRCDALINAAGLAAVELLRSMRGYPTSLLREAFFAKGCYFTLHGERPFRHLVYPMPSDAGLGIHATLDLDGATRFGPNVEWVKRPDYEVDMRHAAEFYDSIRLYWPALMDGALQPDYAGVRPKLVGASMPAADFIIESADVHGRPGLVNLLGIESPGLTSSLAIGEYVADLV